MPSGCKLCVEELVGSPSVRSRLYSMGILPGTEMELCRGGCGNGAVCVRVRQCSLVLGEGMARAIFCRPAEGHEHPGCHHHGPHARHGHCGHHDHHGHHGRHHHHGFHFGGPGCKNVCHGEAAPCRMADAANQPLKDGASAAGAKKDSDA